MLVLPTFVASVYLSQVNLNPVHGRGTAKELPSLAPSPKAQGNAEGTRKPAAVPPGRATKVP